jgi:hypothetical protein
MNDYFTDWLAKEHRADLAREVDRDRRAAPLHEKATASADVVPSAAAPPRHRRWLDILAHPVAHHPHLHAHVRLHPHRP